MLNPGRAGAVVESAAQHDLPRRTKLGKPRPRVASPASHTAAKWNWNLEVEMGTKGPVKLEVLRAKRALKNYQKAVAPLFLRVAELDHEAPATKAARKGLDEIAIELADNGELSRYVESIDRIAKEKDSRLGNIFLSSAGGSALD